MPFSSIKNFLSGLFSGAGQDRLGPEEVAALRAEFRARYHEFKLLLTAGKRSWAVMHELEDALRGNRVFGMSFIRAKSIQAMVGVYGMIQRLEKLAPGKYRALAEGYREIRDRVETVTSRRVASVCPLNVMDFADVCIDASDQIGRKLAALADAREFLGATVAPGFVLTTRAWDRFMAHNDLQAEIDRRLQVAGAAGMIGAAGAATSEEALRALSLDVQSLFLQAEIPPDVAVDVANALERLKPLTGPGGPIGLALRASAMGESWPDVSFSGHFRAELCVKPDDVLEAYRSMLAKKYSLKAMRYRLEHGVPPDDVSVAVGVFAMVDAVCGGVVRSRNPLNEADVRVFVHAAPGLPLSAVEGEPMDVFVVARTPREIALRRPAAKRLAYRCAESGPRTEELSPQEAQTACLTDAQVLELAKLAISLDDLWASGVEAEWAMDRDGRIVLLQARPFRTVAGPAASPAEGAATPLDLIDPNQAGVTRCARTPLMAGGVTASGGVVSGPAVVTAADGSLVCEQSADDPAAACPQGAALVATGGLLRHAHILPRLAGVIAESGDPAGHFAQLCREASIPAIFSMPGATGRIRNGEIITLDADAREVHAGRVDEVLLAERGARPGLRLGRGPVHDILRAVRDRVCEFSLVDSQAPNFKAKNCKTLGDITRFCHESALQEMYDFALEKRFPERLPKQLVTHQPLQWWVVDLDDGFTRPIEERFVRLEDIASDPMLAVWDGINAIPWAGPPPVDARGFMSVMFESTVNPDLSEASANVMKVRNYFMVAKNFVEIRARFGYHLTGIEGLVTAERPSENYVNFLFKGGAAEIERRRRRAFFVGEILEEFGFRPEIHEDALFASIEGGERHELMKKLLVLGYMIIHTRQLDMIMKLRSAVERHKQKILADVATLLEREAAGEFSPLNRSAGRSAGREEPSV